MATRYYCDGCDAQFPEEDHAHPMAAMLGQGNVKAPKVALFVYESEGQLRTAYCSWACLAACAVRRASALHAEVNWQFPDEIILPTTEETTDGP